MLQKLKNLLKHKRRPTLYWPLVQLEMERETYHWKQEMADRKLDRCVERVAQDALYQWLSFPYGIIVLHPCTCIITEYPGQKAKYTSESYHRAIRDRLRELKDDYIVDLTIPFFPNIKPKPKPNDTQTGIQVS